MLLWNIWHLRHHEIGPCKVLIWRHWELLLCIVTYESFMPHSAEKSRKVDFLLFLKFSGIESVFTLKELKRFVFHFRSSLSLKCNSARLLQWYFVLFSVHPFTKTRIKPNLVHNIINAGKLNGFFKPTQIWQVDKKTPCEVFRYCETISDSYGDTSFFLAKKFFLHLFKHQRAPYDVF